MYNNRYANRYNQSSTKSPTPDNLNPNVQNQKNESGFNEQIKGISPIKLKIINEIREKSKNKSMEQLLPEIMKINQELNRRNMNFTKEESALLLNAIEESLDDSEKPRFQMLKSFL